MAWNLDLERFLYCQRALTWVLDLYNHNNLPKTSEQVGNTYPSPKIEAIFQKSEMLSYFSWCPPPPPPRCWWPWCPAGTPGCPRALSWCWLHTPWCSQLGWCRFHPRSPSPWYPNPSHPPPVQTRHKQILLRVVKSHEQWLYLKTEVFTNTHRSNIWFMHFVLSLSSPDR